VLLTGGSMHERVVRPEGRLTLLVALPLACLA
jgi:hypothetical protein